MGSLVSGRYRITRRPNIRFWSEFYTFLRYSWQLLAVGNPFFQLSRASIGSLLLAGWLFLYYNSAERYTHTHTHKTARQPRRLKLGFMEDCRACFRAQWGLPAPIHLTAARCAQEPRLYLQWHCVRTNMLGARQENLLYYTLQLE